MVIQTQQLRDGTGQRNRAPRALSPDHVAVDDRTLADWIRFVQTFSKQLTFFDETNQPFGNWHQFFEGDAEAIATAVETLSNGSGELPAEIRQQLAQPHFALFLANLKLLQYPQQQFKALTQRRLDFYYREVLQLSHKAAIPNQAHIVFTPTDSDSSEAVKLEVGTRLSAGTDANGNDIYYALDTDTYVTSAQVASVKSLLIEKESIDLEKLHNGVGKNGASQSEARTNESFETMLRWALGMPNQGDRLPTLIADEGTETPISVDDLNGMFNRLKTARETYVNESPTLLEIAQALGDREINQQYLLERLCFANLEDFYTCFEVHSQELAQRQPNSTVAPPTEQAWQQVYAIVERAYRKRINRDRRLHLQQTHQDDDAYADSAEAFLGLWQVALGDPNSGDPLPPLREEQPANLNELLAAIVESDATGSVSPSSSISRAEALQYVQSQLFLSSSDFEKIMARQQTNWHDPSADWAEVYRLLDRAQSRKRGLVYPAIAQTVPHAVRSKSLADNGAALSRFTPFSLNGSAAASKGSASKTAEEKETVEGNALGMAISSPLLQLQSGQREIVLTLACQASSFNRNEIEEILSRGDRPFSLQVSGENGWLPVADEKVQVSIQPLSSTVNELNGANEDGLNTDETSGEGLQFKVTLDVTDPAVAPLPPQTDEDGSALLWTAEHPFIKLTLSKSATQQAERQQAGAAYYGLLKDLCFEAVYLQVTVKDLQGAQLRNDRSTLNPKSPFEPFDTQPAAGASFYFTHPELVSKKLDNLSLTFGWMGLPQSFDDHYFAYARCGLTPQPPAITNDSFKVQLDLYMNRTWHALNQQPLFSRDNANKLSSAHQVMCGKAHFAELSDAEFQQPFGAIAPDDLPDDILEGDRYFRLELAQPDFQHTLYPLVMNKVARASDSQTVAGSSTLVKDLTVYPPYTPKVKSLSINYSASTVINLKSDNRSSGNHTHAGREQIIQMHPFGYRPFQDVANKSTQPTGTTDSASSSSAYYFLPRYDQEGALHIGVKSLYPQQQLRVLFQLVSGSGDADVPTPDVQWSYLADDGWQLFEPDQILSDTTNGLLDSGIVRFVIPAAATETNPLMPQGLHWLRASVREHGQSLPDLLDIRAQAATVTLVTQSDNKSDTGLDDLIEDANAMTVTLPAESITGLVEQDAAIAKVEQPYSSFGGRAQEKSAAFYTRASERLRHKQRAVTRWDYERLVLEQFPQIYKAKCLNQVEQSSSPGATPGSTQVTVIVIPNLNDTAPFLPLEPKAPQYLLREIETYLQAHTSLFVKVVVKNPHYERIKYRVGVKLQPGADQGYSLKTLNEELIRFLSPWAYEEQSDISFSSSIHSSEVIHFIETRPYVDYVANLKLIELNPIDSHQGMASTTETTSYQVNTTNLAQVKTPESILVSAPGHIIDLISASEYEEEEFEGIDYMIVGVDFVVS